MAKKKRCSSKRKHRRMRGGSAWQYVEDKYGNMQQQLTDVNNNPAPGNLLVPRMPVTTIKGGRRHKKRRGGNFLATAAVPAALLAASHMYSKRRRHRGGSCGCTRKHRGGGHKFSFF